MTTNEPGPRAFSGSRLGWADLPRSVRSRIADLAGAEVVSEASATSGFSPGYAATLELGNGTEVFVKAVSPEQNPHSPDLARAEVVAARALPAEVRSPRLLWSDDDGTWVLLGFQAVHGRSPAMPWQPEELGLVLAAVEDLAQTGTGARGDLHPLTEDLTALAPSWQRLAEDPTSLDAAVAAAGEHGAWLRDHLADLADWARDAPEAAAGDCLVHGDLRGDNVMIEPDGTVWLIDWPWAAAAGAPWYDLLSMLPSVAMQGGGDPGSMFWRHPVSRGADPDAVRSTLAALTGYFVHGAVQPPPPGIGNLREFQRAQGLEALAWLRSL
ncbi:phosphotransferase [Actinotalea sp. BY-33]|uniref:Phosphotransferase n=1 Tax=Actinotalea soli TaxID=2819234 RepID=A0A939LQ01_9CELL|nr:phosphotransferase [Actinotalea soli]MBO1750830.1 phosphotransferase [Actinotalea soli]